MKNEVVFEGGGVIGSHLAYCLSKKSNCKY